MIDFTDVKPENVSPDNLNTFFKEMSAQYGKYLITKDDISKSIEDLISENKRLIVIGKNDQLKNI